MYIQYLSLGRNDSSISGMAFISRTRRQTCPVINWGMVSIFGKMLVAWVQSNSTSLLHVFVSTYHLDEMKRPSAVRRLFLQTGRRVCLPVSSGKRANLQKSLMSLAPGNALQCSHAKGCELKKGQAWSARRLAKGVLKRFCTEAKKFQGRCAQVTNGRK